MNSPQPPVVAIDARGYFTRGGVGRYTRNLVREIVSSPSRRVGLRLLLPAGHQHDDLGVALPDDVAVVVSRAGWLNAEEEDRWLDEEIAGVQLFHSLTGHWLPSGDAARVPGDAAPAFAVRGSIATLHGLAPLMRPRLACPDTRRAGLRIASQVGRASHLVVSSHSTAGDARAVLAGRVPPMTVIPEAAAPSFRPGVRSEDTLRRYDLRPDGFLFAVGAPILADNLERLLTAYGQSGLQMPLVIAGSQPGSAAGMYGPIARQRLEARVRLIGEVSDEELAALYGTCRAFVYPSLYVGFGLPVIEALACGAAVVAARSSSIPEVTGDAALLADPTRTRSLVSALKRIDADVALRVKLRRLAVVRAAAFSWARTASATQRVYESVLEARAA